MKKILGLLPLAAIFILMTGCPGVDGGETTPPPPPPPPPTGISTPTNLRKLDSDFTSFTVTWDTVPTAVSYKLFRATTVNGTYSQVQYSSDNTYIQTSLSPDIARFYKVQAIDDQNNLSGLSSPVELRTNLVPAPENLRVITLSEASFRIEWDSLAGAESYKVEMHDKFSSTWSTKLAATTGLFYQPSGTYNNNVYYFRVSAKYGSYYSSVPSLITLDFLPIELQYEQYYQGTTTSDGPEVFFSFPVVQGSQYAIQFQSLNEMDLGETLTSKVKLPNSYIDSYGWVMFDNSTGFSTPRSFTAGFTGNFLISMETMSSTYGTFKVRYFAQFGSIIIEIR